MKKVAMEKVKDYSWNKIVIRTVEIFKEVIADIHEQKSLKIEQKGKILISR